MNALHLARTAYATTAPVRTPRTVEYEAFARITERLRRTSESRSDFASLAAALFENGRLWTILAADVADAGNALPAPVRARILYLAEFTRVHTRQVLRGAASADALVDVNLAIMRGLRDEGGGSGQGIGDGGV